MFPGPLGCSNIGIDKRIIRRISRLDRYRIVFRQKQNDPNLQHRGHLESGCPQHVVQRSCHRKLLGEQIQIFRRSRPCPRGGRLPLHRDGEVGGDERHAEIKQKSDKAVRRTDRQRVTGLQKEEVEGDRAKQRSIKRRAQTAAHGGRQNGHQENKREVLHIERLIEHDADHDRQPDKQGAVEIGPEGLA
ncbi:hypothetical protein D3C86_1337120 [compost metagenome]